MPKPSSGSMLRDVHFRARRAIPSSHRLQKSSIMNENPPKIGEKGRIFALNSPLIARNLVLPEQRRCQTKIVSPHSGTSGQENHRNAPNSVRARLTPTTATGKLSVYPPERGEKEPKMNRKGRIITRNSIFDLHCCIPNMSDRRQSQKSALKSWNQGTDQRLVAVKSAQCQ